MSGLFKNYKMSPMKELEGVEIQRTVNEDGTVPTFRIAHASPSNTRYTKSMERISDPYRRDMEMKTMKPEVDRRLSIEVFIDSVLMGWKNVQDENGKDIPFSVENARMLFNALPELYYDLAAEARNLALFKADQLEKEAKN